MPRWLWKWTELWRPNVHARRIPARCRLTKDDPHGFSYGRARAGRNETQMAAKPNVECSKREDTTEKLVIVTVRMSKADRVQVNEQALKEGLSTNEFCYRRLLAK